MPSTGWRREPLSFRDWSHERLFGAAVSEEMKPLGRDITGRPVIYQGETNSCVSCAVTWIAMYLEESHPDLSWPWLFKVSGSSTDGATPKQVLEPARKVGICDGTTWESQVDIAVKEMNAAKHRIAGYAFIRDLSPHSLYSALKRAPIMVGVRDFRGLGDHMMAAYDLTEDGTGLKCANWWDPNVQDTAEIPFKDACFAASILTERPESRPTMPMLQVLKSKIGMFLERPWAKVLTGALGLSLIVLGSSYTTAKFGASGVVANYDTSLSASISNADTSISVSSVTLKTGEVFTSADLHFPIYLTIDPGSTNKEDVECWGLTSLTWTGCVRGLSSLGGSATSTVTGANKPHSQGTRVTMSNVPFFFNRFVDVYTAQNIDGKKTFRNASTTFGNSTGNIVWNGTNLGWSDDGINTFTFAAGGSGITASSTRGVCVVDSEIAVNLGTTCQDTLAGGLTFTAGVLGVAPSSTKFMAVGSDGRLYMDSTSFATSTEFATASANPLYGDGSDGAVLISANATLTRNMFYSSTTIAAGVTLYPNGYRIFARDSLTNAGTISVAGGAGTNGVANAAGSGGAAGSWSIWQQTGLGGKAGGAGVSGAANGAGATSTDGHNATNTWANDSAAGGNGGGCLGGFRGGAGASGTIAGWTPTPREYFYASFPAYFSTSTFAYVQTSLQPGSSGGGGGGKDATTGAGDYSGGGGGGGGTGGYAFIASPIIVNTGTITATGGNGGNGGNGLSTDGDAACGGGGGGGGAGGFIFLAYQKLTNTGTITVAGGSGGAVGTGSGTACNPLPKAGNAAGAGKRIDITS